MSRTFVPHVISRDSALGGSTIERSLRFNHSDSPYLVRTPSSASNRRTWTWSSWVKYTTSDHANFNIGIFQSGNGGVLITQSGGGNPGLKIRAYAADSNTTTTQLFRDPTAWFHVVLAVDTTQSTSSDRVKLYINGVQVTDFSSESYPSQNAEGSGINNTSAHYIGSSSGGSGRFLDAYLAEINFIDGQALGPTEFGFTEQQTGIWRPKKFILTAPNNGVTWSSTTQFDANVFNGNFTNNFLAQVSNGYYTATTASFTIKQSLGVITGDGYHWGARLNGSTEVTTGNLSSVMGHNPDVRIVDFDLSGVTLPFDVTNLQLKTGTGSSGSTYIYGIVVDGVVLINGVTSNMGVNGFHLDFSDNSGTTATTLGKDSSGNGNNFTPNNFSVATGSAVNIYNNDSSTDTPSENFATLNKLHGLSYNTTFANGNLFANIPASNTYGKAFGDIVIKSGKWYWEVYYNQAGGNGNYLYVGLGDMVKGDDFIRAVRGSDGEKIPNTGGTEVRFATGDIINVAVDMDNGKWYIGRNGTYWYSGNPVAGTGFVHNDLLTGASTYGGLVPRFSNATGGATQQFSVNFGQKSFIYTPPTGYRKLNSNNIPVDATPSILNPKKHFDTLLYTGDNTTTRNISGLEFQPDFVWIKPRSFTSNHVVLDSVRGVHQRILPNSSGAEVDNSATIKAFNTDGFQIGNSSLLNTDGATHVAWCWKAGGAAVSNSDGTITSTLSANQEAGFSIVTWTGTGSAATIGHGLGKAPKLIIVKLRNGSQDWFVNNGMIFNEYGKYYKLSSSSGSDASDTNVFPNTAPTSTVFSVGTDSAVNASSSTYVAYVWSEIPGFSQFGYWTGSGTSKGPYVHTGFTPRMMIYRKKSDENWHIMDTKRDSANPNTLGLDPNLPNAEADDSNLSLDFDGSGFKVRSSHSTANTSGTDYFYYTWAEQPSGTIFGLDANGR